MEEELGEKRYKTYYMQVYSYLVSLSGDRELSEELTQATFFRALTSRAVYRGEASEATWLCAIAKNLFADEMRKRKKQTSLPEDLPAQTDIESASADKDLSFRIHCVLHTLSEPYREVFELRVFGDLSFAEIGTVFGKTESWARVTYHRAKMQIQERMGGI